jgi:hypothetical protein
MGTKRLDSISAYARHGYDLRVECRCSRVAVLDAGELARVAHATRRSRAIASIVGRLRCAECGAPPRDWGPVEARK